jgi:hypothetical protein
VNLSPDRKTNNPQSSIRMDARLDQATRQKVDDLAQCFHQPRAAVLCHLMRWGLSRKHTQPVDQGDTQGPVCHLHLCVPSDLHEQVEKAAAAVGAKTAPWLRQMVRRISVTDFPVSWQEGPSGGRSHDSRHYDTRFMLRLDEPSRINLQDLIDHFHLPKATIIRHLLIQATPQDFPKSWHMRAAERRVRPSGNQGTDTDGGLKP